jgi:inner membrane transporter RhtA
VLAAMNSCFYEAIARLPLGTVSAIEFLPVIALAALGARSPRNVGALALAVAGVYVLMDVRLRGGMLGFGLAFANAGLFALYIVLAHRVSRQSNLGGIDGLAMAMLLAVPAVCALGGWQVVPHLLDPVALAAGIGVGVTSSVIPYVCDQLAMARLPRATYSLMVSLLPATATVVGLVVLGQTPSPRQLAGVSLVVAALAVHRERRDAQESLTDADVDCLDDQHQTREHEVPARRVRADRAGARRRPWAVNSPAVTRPTRSPANRASDRRRSSVTPRGAAPVGRPRSGDRQGPACSNGSLRHGRSAA